MNKKIQAIALCAVALLSACTGEKESKTSTEKTAEKAKVKIAQVAQRPVDQIQEYTASVQPEAKNHIAPSMPVRISQIYVEIGDRVAKGQKLVQMDAANLKQMELQLENQRVEFNRIDELYKVGGVSKSEWDAVKMAVEIRQTSYKNMLENTTLISPIGGVVTARNFDQGDMYGGAQPILTIEQIMPVKLIINVSETYFAKINKGVPVQVKIDVYPNETFEGKVSLVHPTINVATRTFGVEVELPNRDLKIRPGMFARASINFGTIEHVVVPDLAVIKQAGSGDRYIYVYKDGKVSYNKVALGQRLGSEYEVISGVENQAQVVVAGQSRLLDGMEVEIEK